MTKDAIRIPVCRVCLIEHDPEIHQATLDVRRWFAYEVTKHFEDALEECEEMEAATLPAA